MSMVTGTLGHALLGLLAERPRTGYGLLKHFEQSLAYAWPASPKQRAYRVALVGGLLTLEARIRWAEWALEEVSSGR